MRRYGQRQMVVLLVGAAVTLAGVVSAMLDQYGIALAAISLLLGLAVAVGLDNRQRLRRLAQLVTADVQQSRQVTGRLDAVSVRLLASIETERTDAVDRHAETMEKLDELTGRLPERSNRLG